MLKCSTVLLVMQLDEERKTTPVGMDVYAHSVE
jgi:hypothetical protein